MTIFSISLNQKEKKLVSKKLNLLSPEDLQNLKIKDFLIHASTESEEDRYKRLRNEKLEEEIKYKRLLVAYFENFSKPPSPQGIESMKINSKQRPHNELEIIGVSQFFEVDKDKYVSNNNKVICKLCGNTFEFSDEILLTELTRHIQALHGSELKDK